MIVSPDLLLDPVEVGVLLSLAGHCLDQGEQVTGHREQGELETPTGQVGGVGRSSWQVGWWGGGEVCPEGGGFCCEKDWLSRRVAGGEDLGVLGPDGEGVRAVRGEGEVGEEDEEALLLTRSNPPMAGSRDREISRVVGRLKNSQAWSRPVNAVGGFAAGR